LIYIKIYINKGEMSSGRKAVRENSLDFSNVVINNEYKTICRNKKLLKN